MVLGLTTPSPTATGGESRLDLGEPAQGVLRVTRHPFLWGVVLWALTHLALNGDSASLALFGALLVLALVGPMLIDAKRKRAIGPKWERFAASTSNVPFAAILSGPTHCASARSAPGGSQRQGPRGRPCSWHTRGCSAFRPYPGSRDLTE